MRDPASRDSSELQLPASSAPTGRRGKGRQSRGDYTSQNTMGTRPRLWTWYHAGVEGQDELAAGMNLSGGKEVFREKTEEKER